MITRDDLITGLNKAIETRIDRMFQNLADSYAGSVNAKTAAQKHFRDGLKFTKEAAAYAVEQIENEF